LAQSCRKAECVLFAGAGLSARAGLPTWKEFLGRLLILARDRKIIDHGHAVSLEAALQEGDRETVADGVVGAFGIHRDLLQDFVRRSFPDSTEPSTSHKYLSQIPFNSVTTSNYDGLLEKAFPKFAQLGVFTSKDAELLLDSLSQKRQFVLKLYGDVNRPDTLIYSQIEYREAISSNVSFSKFMEGYFFSRNFLFVGLSLEGIQEFLSSIVFRGSKPPQHFALVAMEGSASKARAELLLRRYNIQVIPLSPSERFSDLDKFLSNLCLATNPSVSSTSTGSEPLRIAAPGLRRLILEDIGPFEKLEMDFPKDKKWKILLGDNGVGKSTILKAIAAAIIGSDARSYAGRLVRAGKTRGRVTLFTDQNPSGYITDILTKDMLSEAEVVSIPSRPMEAEGWLALGFSPLRVVTWSASTGPQPIVQKGRPTADDLIPLLSGESDPRMDRLKQWIVNLDASDKTSHVPGLEEFKSLQGHTDRVSSIAFSADGRTLISGSIDKTLRSWDVATGRELYRIDAHESGVNAVALSADGKLAASGSYNGTVKLWDLKSRTAVRVLKNNSQVLSVAISSDARTLVSGSEDGSIGIWDDSVKDQRKRLGSHKGQVWSVALSSDGRILVSGSEDGTVRVWDVTTGKEIRAFPRSRNPVWSVATDRDGKKVVAGYQDGSVRVWEIEAEIEIPVLENVGDEVLAVSLAANSQSVVCGSGSGMIKRWDLGPIRPSGTVRGHRSAVWSVAISPDAQTVASGSEDKNIKLWTVTTPQLTLAPFETINKFFDVIGTLTDRKDIEFLRVTENFRVYVNVAHVAGGVPIEVLSQGLTSLFGWVGVLCQRLKETLQGPTNDPLPCESYALVLIDEIDAHMHPRWQQALVSRLKSAFPNVQFIACTHSPLIVGGLDKKEVTRFSLLDGEIAQIDFDPDMTLGRTDQILTGELFNLSTTLDVVTQDLMTEYEALLGKSARSLEEQKRFMTLGQTLHERIPPTPSEPVQRRAQELLETLQSADLKTIDDDARVQVEERMSRLSKTLQGDES